MLRYHSLRIYKIIINPCMYWNRSALSYQWHGDTCKINLLWVYSALYQCDLVDIRGYDSLSSVHVSNWATPQHRRETCIYGAIPCFQDLPHTFTTSDLFPQEATYENTILRLEVALCEDDCYFYYVPRGLHIFLISTSEFSSFIRPRGGHVPFMFHEVGRIDFSCSMRQIPAWLCSCLLLTLALEILGLSSGWLTIEISTPSLRRSFIQLTFFHEFPSCLSLLAWRSHSRCPTCAKLIFIAPFGTLNPIVLCNDRSVFIASLSTWYLNGSNL